MCLHGFSGTWRAWELVLPTLERHHDVLAPTLPGHAGGPDLDGGASVGAVADALERWLDGNGLGRVHLLGNSLGGFLALHLAARGRTETVVALAPAGGWAPGDPQVGPMLDGFAAMRDALRTLAPQADPLLRTDEGRRRATQAIVNDPSAMPAELIAHMMMGVVRCTGMDAMLAGARRPGAWDLDPATVTCPVRFVWGTGDRLLPWPSAAARYREGLPAADRVVLDGVGHCPQLEAPVETAALVLEVTAR